MFIADTLSCLKNTNDDGYRMTQSQFQKEMEIICIIDQDTGMEKHITKLKTETSHDSTLANVSRYIQQR